MIGRAKFGGSSTRESGARKARGGTTDCRSLCHGVSSRAREISNRQARCPDGANYNSGYSLMSEKKLEMSPVVRCCPPCSGETVSFVKESPPPPPPPPCAVRSVQSSSFE